MNDSPPVNTRTGGRGISYPTTHPRISYPTTHPRLFEMLTS